MAIGRVSKDFVNRRSFKIIHMLKQKILAVIFVLAGFISLQAQHGGAFDGQDVEFSGDIVATVSINTVEVTTGTLGAFVGDECRGFVNVQYFPPSDHYVFLLLIYSNIASGETIHVKYYHPATDSVYDVIESIEFGI